LSAFCPTSRPTEIENFQARPLAHAAAGTAKSAVNESSTGLDVGGTAHTNAGHYTNDPLILLQIIEKV
jgi:hypothetical protein